MGKLSSAFTDLQPLPTGAKVNRKTKLPPYPAQSGRKADGCVRGKFGFGGVSIRAKIFLAFFALCLFLAFYGAWSIVAISRAGDIVRDAYDRPVAAVAHAEAARAHFHDARFRRFGLDPDIYTGGLGQAAAAPVIQHALVSLEAVEASALTRSGREQSARLSAAIIGWRDSGSLEERRRAEDIASEFDRLIAALRSEAQTERQRAIDSVERFFALGAMTLGAGLTVAILLAWLIGGQITRPLYAAAELADRLAQARPEQPKAAAPAPVRALQNRLRKAVSSRPEV